MSLTGKGFVFDFANNYGGPVLGVRRIEFYNKTKIINPQGVLYAGATSEEQYYSPWRAFYSPFSKVGLAYDNQFQSATGVASGVRLFCSFADSITFTKVVVYNAHDSGGSTEYGVKDVQIYMTPDEMTAPGNYGEPPANASLIFDGVFNQHVSSDVEDPQELLDLAPLPIPISVFVPAMLLRLTLSAQVEYIEGNQPEPPAEPSLSGLATLYFCTVTGAENGLPDLMVPITSFQSRRRSGSPSYLQAVAPGLNLYDEIVSRADGDLVISMAQVVGGSIVSQSEIARVNIGNVDSSKGAREQSVTISGTKQTTYADGKTVALDSVESSARVSGERRIRMSIPEPDINPGDTVTVGDNSCTVDLVTTRVGIDKSGKVTGYMEVSGADG